MDNRQVLKVMHKKQKKPVYIKLDRFDPGLHEKIDGVGPVPISIFKQRLLANAEKGFIVPKGVTLAPKRTKKEKEKAEKELEESTDPEKGVPKNMFKARKWAADHGMEVTPDTKKADIVAWAQEKGLV